MKPEDIEALADNEPQCRKYPSNEILLMYANLPEHLRRYCERRIEEG